MKEHADEALLARIADLERQIAALRVGGSAPQPSVVVTTVREGRIVQASDGFARLAGYQRAQLLGRTTSELGLWRNPTDRARAIEDLTSHGGHGTAHLVLQRADGTQREIAAEMQRIRAADGDLIVSCIADSDIGAEGSPRSGREQEELLQFVIHNAPIIVFTSDRAGLITMSDGKTLSRLGLRSGEHVGKSIFDLYGATPMRFADGTAISVAEVMGRALAGEVLSGRTELPGGVVLENWVSPLQDPAGAIDGVVGMSMDVSERAVLETQLLHARKLEALGRLAGGVAHDFNNMLSVILGFSEILLEEWQHENEGESQRRGELEEIVAAARRSSELTRQLLAFGRKQVLRPGPLDVGSLLGRLERMLRRLIGEHIEIVTRVLKDVPCALADAGQVEQLIVNLALNGRDAMPRGGKLYLSVGEAMLGEAEARPRAIQPGRYVVLSVEDTGSGMDRETLSRVFEPFFTTKQLGQGTGLGLSTAHGFVRQSGGDIDVESEPGQGTTFRAFLPATDQRAAAPAESARALLTGNETILVAEDEAMVLHLATEVLRRAGYRVIGARTGTEALEMASTGGEIDLLLSDVVLGDLSGPDLAARMSSARPSLRTVYMSGYSSEEVPEPLVQKPFAAAALLRAVRDALDNRGA